MMMFAVLLIGGMIGFGCGYACWQTQLEVLKETHKREVKELTAEIGRARAQVAKLIGTDATPCDELHRRRSACQAEQADCLKKAA